MAGATEGLDLDQTLDVQSHVAAQVAFNEDVCLIDVVADLSLFVQSQILDAGIGWERLIRLVMVVLPAPVEPTKAIFWPGLA